MEKIFIWLLLLVLSGAMSSSNDHELWTLSRGTAFPTILHVFPVKTWISLHIRYAFFGYLRTQTIVMQPTKTDQTACRNCFALAYFYTTANCLVSVSGQLPFNISKKKKKKNKIFFYHHLHRKYGLILHESYLEFSQKNQNVLCCCHDQHFKGFTSFYGKQRNNETFFCPLKVTNSLLIPYPHPTPLPNPVENPTLSLSKGKNPACAFKKAS